MVRLHKFLADAGVASRRASEEIILAGRVAVNGQLVRQLGTKVDPVHDQVTVDGRPLRARRRLYVALHKPRGYLCTRRDPADRRVIGELLPKEWAHLHSVGRLDRDSEGLIFLTNDGEFSLRLTHPRFSVLKKYLATIEGCVEPALLARLVHGVVHEGERLKAQGARLLSANNTQSVVELELSEGKYREVRRLFDSQGCKVASLKRVQIGPIKLGELPSGKWRTLTATEVRSLLKPV
jgi:23S rRNA pseudouridine2605 synthase